MLEEGAARAGRDLDGFDIAPTVQVFVTDDLAGARDAMRPFIALYVGGMGSRKQNFYNQLVQRYGFEDAAREVQDLYLDGKREEAMAALPDELIDLVALAGPPDHVRERLRRLPRRRRRDAGRHADGVGPGRAPRAAAPDRRACRRLIVGCGCSWAPSATRGTRSRSSRWAARWWRAATRSSCRRGRAGRPTSRAAGMALRGGARVPRLPHARAPAEALRGGRAGDRARRARWSPTLRPDAVVADILTLAPALAGELEGVPVATVIPHTDPRMAPRLAALLGGRAPAAHARRAAPVGRDRRG